MKFGGYIPLTSGRRVQIYLLTYLVCLTLISVGAMGYTTH